jgi:hypothetical protein
VARGFGRRVTSWSTAGVVEGTVTLLHWFRHLRIRWEIRDDIHQASVTETDGPVPAPPRAVRAQDLVGVSWHSKSELCRAACRKGLRRQAAGTAVVSIFHRMLVGASVPVKCLSVT